MKLSQLVENTSGRVMPRDGNHLSLPIPKSIPAKYHKYILDYDNGGMDYGRSMMVLVGLAWEGANGPDPVHTMGGTVAEFKYALKYAEPCQCENCTYNLSRLAAQGK